MDISDPLIRVLFVPQAFKKTDLKREPVIDLIYRMTIRCRFFVSTRSCLEGIVLETTIL